MLVQFQINSDPQDHDGTLLWEPENKGNIKLEEVKHAVMVEKPHRNYGNRDPSLIMVDTGEGIINHDLIIESGRDRSVHMLDVENSITYNMTTSDFTTAVIEGLSYEGKIMGPFKIVSKGVRNSVKTI